MRPQLHERLLALLPDGDVFTPYGATEALPVAFMNGRAVLAETAAQTREGKGTCVGALAPDVAVKIIAITDEAIATLGDARELPAGEIGEIIVRGPCVTRAYDDTHSDARARPTRRRRSPTTPRPRASGTAWATAATSTPRAGCGSAAARPTAWRRRTARCTPSRWRRWRRRGGTSRAAFVGLGPRGRQLGVIIFEMDGVKPQLAPDWEATTLASLRSRLGSEGVHAAMMHFGPLPVDRRHNAKLEREALASWAARQRPTLVAGSSDSGGPA